METFNTHVHAIWNLMVNHGTILLIKIGNNTSKRKFEVYIKSNSAHHFIVSFYAWRWATQIIKKKKKECQSLCRKSSMAIPLKHWLSKLSILYRGHLLGSGHRADQSQWWHIKKQCLNWTFIIISNYKLTMSIGGNKKNLFQLSNISKSFSMHYTAHLKLSVSKLTSLILANILSRIFFKKKNKSSAGV